MVDGKAFGLTGGRQAAGVQGAGLAGELPVRRNNEVEEVRSLMAPPLERLEIYAVSTAVSNVRCTGSAEQRITVLRRLMCDTRPSTGLRHRS